MVNRARPKSRLNSFLANAIPGTVYLLLLKFLQSLFARWEYSLQFFSVPLCLCGE